MESLNDKDIIQELQMHCTVLTFVSFIFAGVLAFLIWLVIFSIRRETKKKSGHTPSGLKVYGIMLLCFTVAFSIIGAIRIIDRKNADNWKIIKCEINYKKKSTHYRHRMYYYLGTDVKDLKKFKVKSDDYKAVDLDDEVYLVLNGKGDVKQVYNCKDYIYADENDRLKDYTKKELNLSKPKTPKIKVPEAPAVPEIPDIKMPDVPDINLQN